MKKMFSALVLSLVFLTSVYTPKSQAGVIMLVSGTGLAGQLEMQNTRGTRQWYASRMMLALGAGMVIVGGIGLNSFPGFGLPFMILAEDGNISQEQLESALTERYSFLSDREVISEMAQALRVQAHLQKPDAEGKVVVSLSEEQIKSILAPQELSQEEVATIVSDLK